MHTSIVNQPGFNHASGGLANPSSNKPKFFISNSCFSFALPLTIKPAKVIYNPSTGNAAGPSQNKRFLRLRHALLVRPGEMEKICGKWNFTSCSISGGRTLPAGSGGGTVKPVARGAAA